MSTLEKAVSSERGLTGKPSEVSIDQQYCASGDWTNFSTILIGWPLREQTWRNNCRPAQQAILYLVSQILQESSHQHITIVIDARSSQTAQSYLKHCISSLNAPKRIDILSLPMDDCWVRDTGPIILQSLKDKSVIASCFKFNAWGGQDGGCYLDYSNDLLLARRMCEWFQVKSFHHSFILEGGSVSSDHQGTLLTTEECLLCRSRNPHLSKVEIENNLYTSLGIQKVIWLPYGSAFDYDTDGHVDNIAIFIRPQTVLLLTADITQNPEQYHRSQAAKKVLESSYTATGKQIKIFEVTAPPPILRKQIDSDDCIRANEKLCASYVNIIILQDCVLAPAFGDDNADNRAYIQLTNAFEECAKKVIMIPAKEFIWGGGGMHCLSLGIPYSS